MKTRFILAGILLLTVGACKDFLDVVPETVLTPANFYQSQADFEQAVGGIYAPLQPLYNQDWVLNEMRSDNTHFVFNIAQRGPKPEEDPSTFTIENNNRNTAGKWTNDYLIISRANQVLSTIDNIDFAQAVKDNLKGQAYFLRAFAYFDLVKNFGGVPVFLEPASSYKDTFKSRTEVAEVYKQIIADAEQAAKLLPNRATQTIGRASSGSAYTLLGDVYINLKRWPEAETALKSVTTQGYMLLAEYGDIFKPTNKGNAETVFDVQYAEGTSQAVSNYLPYRFLPVLTDPSVITGVKPSSSNTDGCYNTPTPDLLAAYEDTLKDKRYKASIGFYSGTSPLVGVTYKNTPYIKKYQFPHARYGETGVNWPVYRYAEVLLLLAEAANEQGRSADAGVFLNQVRTRAGLPNTTATSQTTLREAIWRERRIELAFENKRWHDLVRSGLAVKTMSEYGARIKANPQKYYYPVGSAPAAAAFNVTDRDLLYPIPIGEIIINPDMKQNPGY
ncbi:RagB/SusD family nutrient uptake outer membrane protein [Larkinella terrae]|uniref:RagB/SusD family nutrient uptake outer membrane protein n=1 Tax=Larkinella terrae TaxID=2025311 RepID=A0A7K0EVU1_9BACT|nr:RagB/SusD family nutrient uptake outer membrane protein [Larkinella terrae]MRS65696.1 RagB/SusD family nutrient uptake outer membrane protein [Larkinella terrae]